MKLNAIKKCCMNTGQFLVLHTRSGCWLSNGRACWPTDGMEVREAHIRTLFDIDAKKADDLTIREVEQSDEHLSIEMDPLEERLNNIGYIWDRGVLYAVLTDKQGRARIINTAWLKPAEGNRKELRFVLRKRERGGELVAACGDLLVSAIVAVEEASRAAQLMEKQRELTAVELAGQETEE